ncbi:MAG: barstar family protein [Phycisphaerales bacterium]|nr:barstar family protein [Planctomycetota bacterium]MCH8509012.1 barstar family protein [Phycisphaerales bacterium]
MTRREQAEIQADRITDWTSFHDVFAEVFGFPGFYGRNMDAWIDCMTSLDAPEDGMTTIHAPKDKPLTLVISNASSFEHRCPDVFNAMLACAAFVNGRRMETGERPVLLIATVS